MSGTCRLWVRCGWRTLAWEVGVRLCPLYCERTLLFPAWSWEDILPDCGVPWCCCCLCMGDDRFDAVKCGWLYKFIGIASPAAAPFIFCSMP